MRLRRTASLAGIGLALAAVAVAGGSAARRAPQAAKPTLYFLYTMSCTFAIVDDTGKTVTAIAPGAYQVDIRTPIVFGSLPLPSNWDATDFTACRGIPQFQLTGPGVSLFTTMTEIGRAHV